MKQFIIVFYLVELIFLSIFSYAFIDPNLIYLKALFTSFAFQERESSSAVYLVLLCTLMVSYISFIRLYVNKNIDNRTIINLILLTILILLFSYPAMLSYDIFNYIATAKVSFFYRENPYIIMPIEFIGDPVFQFMHAANKTALYGPAWIGITAAPFILGANNFLITLLLFKLVPVLFYLYMLFLIYVLSRNWLSILLFGLNPLVIMETLISGHNDIVMMSLVLTAFLFLKKKKIILAILFFMLSIGIKFATIFLIPVFIYTAIFTLKKKQIYWEKIYYWSSISMFIIFLLSPFREEMYPWYSIWFFTFVCMVPKHKKLLTISIILLFSLMLRYIPFMYFGEYHALTIRLRTIITLVPLIVYAILSAVLKKNKFISIV